MMEFGDNLLSFCKSIPKIELHAHLNGSISSKTMVKLIERRSHEVNEGLDEWFTTIKKGHKRSLEECFQVFKIVHEIVDDEEAVSIVAKEVVEDFAADNVVYLELRSTPRANPKTGMTKESYVEAMIKGIQEALIGVESQITVRILLSIDRSQSVADAMDSVLLAETYSKSSSQSNVKVVGVDLSGNPYAGDIQKLLPVLKSIKEKGLKFAAHLSEIASQNNESLLVLKQAPPDRIGHGTFMHCSESMSEEVVQLVRDLKIPLEMCLTSNLICKTVSSLKEHHFSYWRNLKHPLIICTDDKGVFSVTLSEEYYLAAKTFGLREDDLRTLAMDAVEHIFDTCETKQKLKWLWNSF